MASAPLELASGGEGHALGGFIQTLSAQPWPTGLATSGRGQRLQGLLQPWGYLSTEPCMRGALLPGGRKDSTPLFPGQAEIEASGAAEAEAGSGRQTGSVSGARQAAGLPELRGSRGSWGGCSLRGGGCRMAPFQCLRTAELSPRAGRTLT